MDQDCNTFWRRRWICEAAVDRKAYRNMYLVGSPIPGRAVVPLLQAGACISCHVHTTSYKNKFVWILCKVEALRRDNHLNINTNHVSGSITSLYQHYVQICAAKLKYRVASSPPSIYSAPWFPRVKLVFILERIFKKLIHCICCDGWSLLPNALPPFKIYCAPPNLGIIRTWICRLNIARRPIVSGLRFFNEPEISDSGFPA